MPEEKNSPEEKTGAEELDLHWKEEDPDLEIASEGVLCKNMDEIIAHIDKVKNTVKKINLHNQHTMTEIPFVLKECGLLEEIDFSHTEITAIPGFLFELPNLRSLSCCCRKLGAPPSGLGKAKKLEKLHIRINEGWSFPEEMASLDELKTLNIDIYSTANFPKGMGLLKKLEDLTLSIKYEKGTVQNLPASFSKHPALKNVSIGDHVFKNHKDFDLEKNAQILSSCPNLVSFTLSGFSIKKHNCLSNLTALKELKLRHLITEGNVFDSIKPLKKLEILDVWGSDLKISSLPDIFGNFSEMRSFSFAGNFVPSLPPSIYSMTKLSDLEIGSTGISALDEKIGNLSNLVKFHIYDNLLEKLPESIFTLGGLEVLNIEENIFSQQEIASIKQKLGATNKSGKKIEFMCDGQWHRHYVKRLRSLQKADAIDDDTYYKHCINAVNENPFALKYVNTDKFKDGRYYAQICLAAVKRTCFALEAVDLKILDKSYYFYICLEAVKKRESRQILKLINVKELTDEECVQICIEAALNNGFADFLSYINNSPFLDRIGREAYERVCWVSILHFPATISHMIDPTGELKKLAQKTQQK